MSAPHRFRRQFSLLSLLAAAAAVGGCAALRLRQPVSVDVVGIEPLSGAGLEGRFGLRLRMLNPNEASVDFDGIALELDVGGLTLARGVSDRAGSVPRFGEAEVVVPLSISIAALLRQAAAAATTGRLRPDYRLSGRLSSVGPAGDIRFDSSGELPLPEALRGGAQR